jgi:hypothetical protein
LKKEWAIMASNGTKKTIRRSSITGRIVTAAYAATHPKTTETERVRVSPPPKKNK